MDASLVALVLWMKSGGDSEGEGMVSRAMEANVLDHVERASRVEAIGPIIVVTDSPNLVETLHDSPAIVETGADLEVLPFGENLASVIEKYSKKHSFDGLLYMGGGSGVFMEGEDLMRLTRAVRTSPEILFVNSFYSTDFAGFGRAFSLEALRRCQSDNQIGWVLGREEGRETRVLPPGLMTRFDIDTPADLMILKVHPPRSPHLSEILSSLSIDVSPVYQLMDVLVRREASVMVMGRVTPEAALFFDKETACHLRFYIEERGLKARKERGNGETWSLAGLCLERIGALAFFETLSAHLEGVILDSRVLFHHLELQPLRRDRFFSDLLRPGEITDPSVRRFTEEALESPIPILLGGHTLVSGGLYALAESAWRRAEKPLGQDVNSSNWG